MSPVLIKIALPIILVIHLFSALPVTEKSCKMLCNSSTLPTKPNSTFRIKLDKDDFKDSNVPIKCLENITFDNITASGLDNFSYW